MTPMEHEMTITEARDRLTQVPDELARDNVPLTVTRHGQPVLAVLPWELYEGLLETLDILSDANMRGALRESLRDLEAGEMVPLDDLIAEMAEPSSV